MPSDIQVMINNNEKGMALLRIVAVIGQDELEKIDEDTIYFIINTLNQLNIDFLRNKIFPLLEERWNNFPKRVNNFSTILSSRNDNYMNLIHGKYSICANCCFY